MTKHYPLHAYFIGKFKARYIYIETCSDAQCKVNDSVFLLFVCPYITK